MIRWASLLFLALPAEPPPPEVEILTVDEEDLRGEILRLEGTTLEMRTAAGDRSIDCRDVLAVRFPRRVDRVEPGASLLDLENGDRLYGRPVSGEGDRLRFALASGPVLDLLVSSLRRWVRLGAAEGRAPEDFTGDPEEDRVYRMSDGGLDHLDGTFLSFEDDGFRFESPLGVTRFAFEDTVSLVLVPEGPERDETRFLALLDLSDGSRLTGVLESLSGETCRIALAAGPRLELPARQLVAMRFRNGRYVYLSELEPASREETPFFGGPDALRFPVGRDRAVGGGPLRCAGREYSRGLGLHARTRLRYALDGGYRAFRGSVGIDDEVLAFPRSGSALLRISVDGRTVFESPALRAGAEPVPVPEIPLEGAKELVVEADFGDQDPIGDRVDLLEPILIRP